MEAPEKIQVHLIKNNCDDWSIEGYSFLEDKQIGMTEYTRTDVFIEKARDYIEDNMLSSNQQDKSRLYYKQFENYIKGK